MSSLNLLSLPWAEKLAMGRIKSSPSLSLSWVNQGANLLSIKIQTTYTILSNCPQEAILLSPEKGAPLLTLH